MPSSSSSPNDGGLGEQNKVAAIEVADKPDGHGAKQFRITFEKPVDPAISEVGTYGIENLEWTPEVYFADNVIRNNRARGSLVQYSEEDCGREERF